MEGASRTPTAPARETAKGAALNAVEPIELANQSSAAVIGAVPHETRRRPRAPSTQPPLRKREMVRKQTSKKGEMRRAPFGRALPRLFSF